MKLFERYAGEVKEEAGGRYKLERPYRRRHKREMNLQGRVKVLAFSLVRRGVFLLVWQKEADGVTKFMRRLVTSYTLHANQRHGRKGAVFAGAYRGVLVTCGKDMVYLSRRIHRLPLGKIVRRFGWVETTAVGISEEYLYSSYGNYLDGRSNSWLDPETVLSEWKNLGPEGQKSYREFVQDERVVEEPWIKALPVADEL